MNCIKKLNTSIGLHSDIKLIWFKVDLMTDTMELYIVTQGHRRMKNKKKLKVHFLKNVAVNLDEI